MEKNLLSLLVISQKRSGIDLFCRRILRSGLHKIREISPLLRYCFSLKSEKFRLVNNESTSTICFTPFIPAHFLS